MASTYKQYRDELLERMHAFAVSGPFLREMFDSDLSDRARPPVFKPGFRHLNLILPTTRLWPI